MCSERGDAPKIEVTPEMIEAGVGELLCFQWGLDRAEDVARKIFIAMNKASPARLHIAE